MTDELESPEYKGRENLFRLLEYRKHYKVFYYTAIVFSYFFLFLFFYNTVPEIITKNTKDISIITVIPLLVFSIFNFYLARKHILPFAFTKIFVENNQFTIEVFGKTVQFRVSDVEKIEFQKHYFTIFLAKGITIKISTALERCEYILDSIYSEKPEIFNKEKYYNFRAKSILIDHSWGRLYESLRSPLILLLQYLFVPVLGTISTALIKQGIAVGFDLFFSLQFLLSVLFNIGVFLCIGWLYYGIAELIIYRKGKMALIDHPEIVARQSNYEQLILRRYRFAYYLTAILFYFSLSLM